MVEKPEKPDTYQITRLFVPDQKNGLHTARLRAVRAMVDHKRPNAPTAQRRALYAILEDMASLAGFSPLFYRRNSYLAGSQHCCVKSKAVRKEEVM